MSSDKNRVCPVEKAGGLDHFLRRWVQNPKRILKPFISEGMTVLDLGCGPGYFTLEMALLLNGTAKVIAADLQQGMLDKVHKKIAGTTLENRIKLHKCESDKIGITEKVDFVLAFYMVHEVPNQEKMFAELKSILKSEGKIFIIEPNFHVSKASFKQTLDISEQNGFKILENPKMLFSRTAILAHA